ncbi:MAG: peroxiredoxin family protein, partial [Actinomycetota bacterium]
VVLILTAVTAAGANRVYQAAPKPEKDEHSVWEQIALQHLEIGRRVPGFRLPDGKGGLLGTAAHRGKIQLIYVFAGNDPDAGRMLLALENIRRKYASRGVQPLGVCISTDHGDGWTLARAGGLGFPVGSDHSTVSTARSGSAVLTAYDVDALPILVVTDRRRIVREIVRLPTGDPADLARVVERQLSESGG